MTRWSWCVSAALALAVPASSAGQQTSVGIHLFHFEGGAWVEYFSDPFPADGGTPGTNLWRYQYETCNLAFTTGINEFDVYFNPDNVLRSTWSASSGPTNWTATKIGPSAPDKKWRVRFRTLSTPDRIAKGSCSDQFQAEFTWVGDYLPGAQHYDAVSTVGTDTGVTWGLRLREPTPVRSLTWGRLKAIPF